VRLAPVRWDGLWSAFAHAVRNCADHGLQTAQERAAAGKPPRNQVRLATAWTERGAMRLTLADDGRGIDWTKVRQRAEAAGLPATTDADLQAALFADGLSTADAVTDLSGRGVGLSALKAAAAELGGRVEVCSRPGEGTRFEITIPTSQAAELAAHGPAANGEAGGSRTGAQRAA
jgi:two-component system chemotaxis sensor kinase CheA